MAWMVIIYSLIAATIAVAFIVPNEKLEWRTKNGQPPFPKKS